MKIIRTNFLKTVMVLLLSTVFTGSVIAGEQHVEPVAIDIPDNANKIILNQDEQPAGDMYVDALNFLEDQGYPALAEIVREHIMSTILHPKGDERPWEVKLVYYCDKLVEDEALVPFDKRLSALFSRYPQYRETMGRAAGPVRQLGDQICAILSIPGHEKLISNLIELQNN